jgi:hypothetical protein
VSSIAIPRTVLAPKPKRGRPTKISLERQRRDGLFWISNQILSAENHAERAAILLRVPDQVLTEKSDELRDACFASEFSDGAFYVAARTAATCATRTVDGQLPAHMIEQLESWRRGIRMIAGRTV